MGLFVDLLAASFSSLSPGGKFGRSLLCGLVTAIPGLVIFYLARMHWNNGGSPESVARGKRVSWMILAGWFSVGFFTVWICYWIDPSI